MVIEARNYYEETILTSSWLIGLLIAYCTAENISFMSKWLLFNANSVSASSLKEQSADRHVTPLWHIILILRQQIFALSP
jgi:hypothetical protein